MYASHKDDLMLQWAH